MSNIVPDTVSETVTHAKEWLSLHPLKNLPRSNMKYIIRLERQPFIVTHGVVYDYDGEFISILNEEVINDTPCYKIKSGMSTLVSRVYFYYKIKDSLYFGKSVNDVFIPFTRL